jgi:hypothetical protein
VSQLGNHVARFDDHHPVLSNALTLWLEDEEMGRCTINERYDLVRIALLTHKLELAPEKKRSEKPPSLNESLQQMQQLLLMQQKQQMSDGAWQSTPQSATHPPVTAHNLKPVWMDLEYDDWLEMALHTDNFLEYFKQHWDADIITHSYRNVLFKASIDINAIMDESENSIAQWLVEQDKLKISDPIQLQRQAHRWRKEYTGFTDDQKERARHSAQDRASKKGSAAKQLNV